MKDVLVTGADGFVGSYLTEALRDKGYNVYPLTIERCDLTDYENVKRVLEGEKFYAVFHLAAISSVSLCEELGRECLAQNVSMVENLLEVLKNNIDKFFYISSGEVYGDHGDVLLTEETPTKPISFYGLSKRIGEEVSFFYSRYGVKVVVVRPFTHIGVGQNPRFVFQSMAKQVVMLKKKGGKGIIKAGNVDVVRDITDVRDVVYAYILLLEHGRPGEVYNVTSSNSISIRDGIKMLMDLAGVSGEISVEKSRLRKYDIPYMRGSYEKIHRDTGWKPAISLEETFRNILEYWEGVV